VNRRPCVVALVVSLGLLIAMVGLMGCARDDTTTSQTTGISNASGDDSTDARAAAELRSKLVAAGVDVTSLAVQGKKMTVVANKIEATPENAIESALQVTSVVRAAQEAGMTWLDSTIYVNGRKSFTGMAITPSESIAHVSEGQAAAAVGKWIDEVKSQSGVEARYSFNNYRVDILATGSPDDLEKAADGFMYGTSHLHDLGQLDISTLTAKDTTGETVFVGVADWVVGMVGWPYEAPGFHFGP
jgi:hypothetical protein